MENSLYLPSLNNKQAFRQRGFSLLEMLIASVLGLFISSLFVMLYLSIKSTFQLQKNWSDIQQKGRWVTHLFNRILNQAGRNDCSPPFSFASSLQVVGRVERNQDAIIVYQCYPDQGLKSFLPIDYFIENKKLYFRPKAKSHRKRLLLEGVETMRIEYGIACEHNKAICSYLPASRVTDWRKTRSVSITFYLAASSLKKKWHIYVALPQKEAS